MWNLTHRISVEEKEGKKKLSEILKFICDFIRDVEKIVNLLYSHAKQEIQNNSELCKQFPMQLWMYCAWPQSECPCELTLPQAICGNIIDYIAVTHILCFMISW